MIQKGTQKLTRAQLTGCAESHLVRTHCGNRMQGQAAEAFGRLQQDAKKAGFDLAIASSYRSFARQSAIWNGKVSGERPVHDDAGRLVTIARLSTRELVHAILRYSALPGTSRHHWGTDVDVYDRTAPGEGYTVQLTPQEVAPGGIFDPFHCWLDGRIAADQSHGFYRPYGHDNGGVAPERWHLSYAPVALGCEHQLTAQLIMSCWDNCGVEILLRREVEAQLADIVQRYLVPQESWCPANCHRAT